MVRQDGTTFDAEQSSALLWDAAGEPYGVVSITRDITERRLHAVRYCASVHWPRTRSMRSCLQTSPGESRMQTSMPALFGYQQAPWVPQP